MLKRSTVITTDVCDRGLAVGFKKVQLVTISRAGRRRDPVDRDRVRVHRRDRDPVPAGPDDPPVREAGRRLRAAAGHAARTIWEQPFAPGASSPDPANGARAGTAAARDALGPPHHWPPRARPGNQPLSLHGDASPPPDTNVRAAASSPVSHAARRRADAPRTWPLRIAVRARRTLLAWTCDTAGQIRTPITNLESQLNSQINTEADARRFASDEPPVCFVVGLSGPGAGLL